MRWTYLALTVHQFRMSQQAQDIAVTYFFLEISEDAVTWNTVFTVAIRLIVSDLSGLETRNFVFLISKTKRKRVERKLIRKKQPCSSVANAASFYRRGGCRIKIRSRKS